MRYFSIKSFVSKLPRQLELIKLKSKLSALIFYFQSDDISDEEAVTKYSEYKVNFRRQQLQEFFVAHKDEEWCVGSFAVKLISIWLASLIFYRRLFKFKLYYKNKLNDLKL